MIGTMRSALERQKERRWIILGEDGRFVTLGRASDPSDDEIRDAEKALRDRGLAGWLAVMEGNPNTVAQPTLLMVRPLAEPASTFEQGTAAFRSRRVE
jgi:hypothetical protein